MGVLTYLKVQDPFSAKPAPKARIFPIISLNLEFFLTQKYWLRISLADNEAQGDR